MLHLDLSEAIRSEEHTSELQSHSEISYAVFCLKKKKEKESDGSCCAPKPCELPHGMARILRRLRLSRIVVSPFFFFFNDTATTEIYTNLNTLSLHDALPI